MWLALWSDEVDGRVTPVMQTYKETFCADTCNTGLLSERNGCFCPRPLASVRSASSPVHVGQLLSARLAQCCVVLTNAFILTFSAGGVTLVGGEVRGICFAALGRQLAPGRLWYRSVGYVVHCDQRVESNVGVHWNQMFRCGYVYVFVQRTIRLSRYARARPRLSRVVVREVGFTDQCWWDCCQELLRWAKIAYTTGQQDMACLMDSEAGKTCNANW